MHFSFFVQYYSQPRNSSSPPKPLIEPKQTELSNPKEKQRPLSTSVYPLAIDSPLRSENRVISARRRERR